MDVETFVRNERIIKIKAKVILTKTTKGIVIKIKNRQETLSRTSQTSTINR